MAHSASQSDDAITGINMTPLVDITLVLLIIFMVTAKLIAGQGVPLDLPKAATAGATQTVLTVSIDDQGHVQANGQPMADRLALRAQAQQALKDDPALRTLISASASASHGTVMQVVDSVREAGVTKIAFAADKGEPALGFGEPRP
jgi:biopolymer transport protein ExbD